MKDAIRCCISCILPCGSLDVIRIVHANGHVDEISRTIRAGEIMRAYPKHVLRKPPSSPEDEPLPVGPTAGILSPNAELQRGKIYFLMPVAASTEASAKRRRRKKREAAEDSTAASTDRTSLLMSSDHYLSEILAEKSRDRRRGRVGVWRPHLESISEVSNDS